MQRYEAMKRSKGSGKTITATARKLAVIIWNMLTEDVAFDVGKMTDRGLAKKSSEMGVQAATATTTAAEAATMAAEVEKEEKPAKRRGSEVKKTGVVGKNGRTHRRKAPESGSPDGARCSHKAARR
jgi:hypothetical protein